MKTYKLTIYKSRSLHYWRLRARNGEIISDGSEGYSSASNAMRAAKKLPLDWSRVKLVDQ